jgi:hypothetical protein
MVFAWFSNGKMQHCPFRRFNADKIATCLYTAVRDFHEQCDEVVMRPWHLKESRWLRPGEVCLEGDYDMRAVKND